jgi:cell wall-associated NlpC family hydrolase
VAGDSLAKVSKKFGTSIHELKKLNHPTKDTLRRGQVLKVPSKKASVTKKAVKKTKTTTDDYPQAEPAQSFDVPVSNFATSRKTSHTHKYLHLTGEPTSATPSGELDPGPLVAVKASVTHRTESSSTTALASSPRKITLAQPAPVAAPGITVNTVPPRANRGFFNFFYTPSPATVDWGARFTAAAKRLGDEGISYNDDWRPPGESRSWTMDCSNTARYLYKTTTGIQLPRTASDQYYYLHLQNKAWDVPQLSTGYADTNYLRQNLKGGDLLFWENTYKPDRQPPITHVMVFLGTNERGEWLMAGSQSSRGGAHNRRHGGPDIYVFNPSRPCGGYHTWMGLVYHPGRFCAFGRPLEADKAKLAMAAND